MDHLTSCSKDTEKWRSIEINLQKEIEEVSITLKLSKRQISGVQELLIPTNIEERTQSRKENLRGIIKVELSKKLRELKISIRKSKKVLEAYLERWYKEFQEQIWNPRCKEVTQWEKTIGITRKEKRRKLKGKRVKQSRKEKGRKKGEKGSKEEPSKKKEKTSNEKQTKIRLEESTEKWITKGVHDVWNSK